MVGRSLPVSREILNSWLAILGRIEAVLIGLCMHSSKAMTVGGRGRVVDGSRKSGFCIGEST
jgi:hypothetical protein